MKPPQLGRGARTSFWALNPTWRKRRRTLVPTALARAKPQHTRRRPPQPHGGASASTVLESGAQGTIRLLRAWVKPPQLGRGARASFWALNPTWRKRWRTLVPTALARAKPQHTRRRPSAAPQRSQRQHGEGERSSRHHSLAKDTSEAAPAWPGRAHLVLCSQPTVAQAETHARSLGVGARETTAHATVNTSSATAQPAPAR